MAVIPAQSQHNQQFALVLSNENKIKDRLKTPNYGQCCATDMERKSQLLHEQLVDH